MLRICYFPETRLAALAIVAMVSGCPASDPLGTPAAGGGGTGQAPTAGQGVTAGAAAGSGAAGTGSATSKLYGYFNVTLNPALDETASPPSTSFLGKLYDGPTPSPMAWTQTMEAAGCRLYTPNRIFCEEACTNAAACTADDTCTPYPNAQTVGTVTLTGLGPNAVAMEPKANNYQPPAGTTLPFPPCSAGAEVKLSAAGGNYAPFTLSASCIEPLELAGPVRLMQGQPLTLSWSAGTSNPQVNIAALLDISQHGTSKGKIECDVPDNGSLSIPATLIDALLDLGISGFPSVLVTRELDGVAAAGGPADVFLRLSAPYRREVEIPGLVSCNDDSQCPAGQTCQADLKCE